MAESIEGEHVLQIRGELDFSTAKQQAAAFREEQSKQPVNVGAPTVGGAGGGTGAARAIAERAASETAAVRSQQASADARTALTQTAAQRFIASSLTPFQIAGAQSKEDLLPMARFLNPEGARAFDIQQKEATRINASEARRQAAISRFAEGRDYAYENRIAAETASKERLGDVGLRRYQQRQSAADRAQEKAEAREQSSFEKQDAGRILPAERVRQGIRNEAIGRNVAVEEERLSRAIRETAGAESANAGARELEDAAAREAAGGGAGGVGGGGGGRGGAGGGAGGGRGPGRRAGFRLGRIGQFATVAFIARTADKLAAAYLTRERELTLAGNDQEAQLAAVQRFNQSVSITGEIGASAADAIQSAFYGRDVSRGGTELIAQSARAQDAYTNRISQFREFSRSRRDDAALAAIPDPGDRARLEIEQERDRGLRANTEAGRATTKDAFAINAATITNRETELARFRQLDENLGHGESPRSRALADELRQLYAQRSTAVQKITAEGEKNDAAVEATAASKIRELQRHEAIISGKIRTDTRVNQLQASGLDFEAIKEQVRGDLAGEFAAASNADKPLVQAKYNAIAQRIIRTKEREDRYQTEDLASDTEAINQQTAGNNLGAAQTRIEAERRARQRAVQGKNDALHAEIDRNARAQEQAAVKDDEITRARVRNSLDIGVQTSGLRAEGKPIAAQIAEIAANARAAADETKKRNQPDAEHNAQAIKQTAINDERTLKRQLVDSGSVQEIQSGSFLPGSGQGNFGEETVDLLRQINEAIAKLLTD